jgi:hypothetical protein
MVVNRITAVRLRAMNISPLHLSKVRGFKVVPKNHLGDMFSPSQSAFYVLLGRRGRPTARRERVLFVDYVDDFLSCCQQQIEELWQKHRVVITHVAVKLGRPFRKAPHDLTDAYTHALQVQSLRHKLQPRFRRL